MEIVVPVPDFIFQIFSSPELFIWLMIGATFGRGFGKRLDQDIQASEWFKCKPYWMRWILKRILDVTHHWWIGAIIGLYAAYPQAQAFGWGLFLDDLPDLYKRLRDIITSMKEYLHKKSHA